MSAYSNTALLNSFIANEALTSNQFFAVAAVATGKCDLADLAYERCLGLLQNAPASGAEASVCMLGISKGKLGGTVAMMADVTTNASGKLVAAMPGDFIIGQCLEAGVADDVVPIFVNPSQPFDSYWQDADDDLSSKQYYAVSAHTTVGEVDLAGNGESAFGIVQDAVAADAIVRVRTYGRTLAVAGTSGVTAGDLLGCEDGGKVVTAATGDHVIGVALADITADATGSIFFNARGTVA